MHSEPPFLQAVANHILRHHRHELPQVWVLLPTVEAGTRLMQSIAKQLIQPSFAPRCYTWASLLHHLYPLQQVPNIRLASHLYQAYQQAGGTDSLQQFATYAMEWLQLLAYLHDNNLTPTELFLLPSDPAFSVLPPHQQVALTKCWETFQQEAAQWIETSWRMLAKLYPSYRARVLTAGIADPGLHAQTAAHCVRKGGPPRDAVALYTVGLPPCTPAQQGVLDALNPLSIVPLRRTDLCDTPSSPASSDQNILYRPCQTAMEEAMMACKQLSEWQQEGASKEDAAIVVVGNDATQTLAHHLPAEQDALRSINYPLHQLPLLRWLMRVGDRYSKGKTPNEHIFVPITNVQEGSTLASAASSCGDVGREQSERRSVDTSPDEACLAQELLAEGEGSLPAADCVDALLRRMGEGLSGGLPWVQQGISLLRQAAARWFSDWDRLGGHPTVTDFFAWLPVIAAEESICIRSGAKESGGPRILRWGETSTHSLRKVLIMGASQQTLPRSIHYTLIPPVLAQAYGLPASTEAEDHYLWHDLLSQARDCIVVSHASAGPGSEPTKFLQNGFSLMEPDAKRPPRKVPNSVSLLPDTIEKDAYAMEALARYTLRPHQGVGQVITPTFLGRYLSSPSSFYLRYIARCAPVNSATSSMWFGLAVHGVMEDLYRPHVGGTVDGRVVQDCVRRVPEQLAAWLATHNERLVQSQSGGERALLAAAVHHTVNGLLRWDESYAPFHLHAVELGRNSELQTTLSGEQTVWVLGGAIDRVDEKDGIVRVVDYKTSRCNARIRSVADLFLPPDCGGNLAAMQAIWYAWLYGRAFSQSAARIVPVLHSTRNPNAPHILSLGDSQRSAVQLTMDDTLGAAFEGELLRVLKELWDPSQPFAQPTGVVA